MAEFDKLMNAFNESSNQNNNDIDNSKFRQLNTLQQSLAIVKTIDKLKAQGVPITKKAELDYLLARQMLDKANISPSDTLMTYHPPEPQSDSDELTPVKRNPKDNPEEFKSALEFSKNTVTEVEELLAQNKPVPLQQLETYELCKKFLQKYT